MQTRPPISTGGVDLDAHQDEALHSNLASMGATAGANLKVGAVGQSKQYVHLNL